MKKLRLIFIFLLACCAISEMQAQKVAVKSNLLYDATATFNLGVELGLARKWTLDVPVNVNPWKFSDGMRLRHWGIQPEVRYWLNRPMVSQFLGITAFVNNFNMMVKDVHHKGDAYAAGLTYGYVWVLGDHWNIEATAGVGVLRYRQFKYDKGIPKPDAVNDSKTTIAPVKLGVSFVYIIR